MAGAGATDPREWDAGAYDQLSLPHVEWGRRTLARLPLSGDETVLELGCGAGRDTAALLERLPNGHVIGVDASEQMVAHTRERCRAAGDRLTLLGADLREPLRCRLHRSTPCSASRRCTGCPTTRRCSPNWPASCARAVGWRWTTAARATSPT